MQGLKGRMDSLPQQVLEALLVKAKAEEVLPREEPVLVRVLTELLEHPSDLLHVELGLDG